MKKYLEYFDGAFDSTVAEKVKPENKPYVAYSKTEGVVYTVIPEPVVGPADNEIWYTNTSENVTNPDLGIAIISNTYENGKGIIKFSNSVTSIGEKAFEYNDTLTSIVIPNSVTSIESNAFKGCFSLSSINIPDGVTYIGGGAFRHCTSLASIVIPDSVMSIEWQALSGCSSLASITFQGTIEQWNQINLGEDWNSDTLATYVQCTDGQVTL